MYCWNRNYTADILLACSHLFKIAILLNSDVMRNCENLNGFLLSPCRSRFSMFLFSLSPTFYLTLYRLMPSPSFCGVIVENLNGFNLSQDFCLGCITFSTLFKFQDNYYNFLSWNVERVRSKSGNIKPGWIMHLFSLIFLAIIKWAEYSLL